MKVFSFVSVVICSIVFVSLFAEAVEFTEEEYQQRFLEWTHEHQRIYGNYEFNSRYEVFKRNMDFVYNWNENHEESTMALNLFADLNTEEFGRLYTGLNRDRRHSSHNNQERSNNNRTRSSCGYSTTATDIDWRNQGAVTPIKDQGQCGSCWAFSATGAIEGAVKIASGQLKSFSEQQLIDCSTAQGNEGCNGGLMDNAFQYVISNGGLTTESIYPYTVTGPNTCEVHTPQATITGFCDVTSGSETDLMGVVAQQPVSVAIEADQACFQFYSGGVLSDPSCGTQLDHGVLVVGFKITSTEKYWIVKNSWGTSWGLNGYAKLGMQVPGQPDGVCGIAIEPSLPTGARIL